MSSNTVSFSQRWNESLSEYCLKSCMSSLSSSLITRSIALACSIRAFCLSRMRRSVTTMMESKIGRPFFSRPVSWCASQAMELDLPHTRSAARVSCPSALSHRRGGR